MVFQSVTFTAAGGPTWTTQSLPTMPVMSSSRQVGWHQSLQTGLPAALNRRDITSIPPSRPWLGTDRTDKKTSVSFVGSEPPVIEPAAFGSWLKVQGSNCVLP